MIYLRAALFNILFFVLTALACILFLPTLLFSRKATNYARQVFLNQVYFLERYVLGLDYEVRGLEHLPKSGSYIVAAKHESAYETMKLHFLFEEPVIVLKQELLNIPLWGKFLERTKPIAIDRKAKKSAMLQIIEGVKDVAEDERPVIIFPQGTRVYSWQTPKEKNYKAGVLKLQKETGLPIIPMALNTGLFWSRSGIMKYGGKVIFEFLPAYDHRKYPGKELHTLQNAIEQKSNALKLETIKSNPVILDNGWD